MCHLGIIVSENVRIGENCHSSIMYGAICNTIYNLWRRANRDVIMNLYATLDCQGYYPLLRGKLNYLAFLF